MRSLLLIVSAFAFMFSVQGCVDFMGEIYREEEKKEIIEFGVNLLLLPTEETKSANEESIKNLNIYVVDQTGNVITHKYTSTNTYKSVEVEIYSGKKYTVYAIANSGKSLPAKDIEEITALKHSINSASDVAESANGILMCGGTDPQILSDGAEITVKLKRCVSKIILKADYTNLNNFLPI